MGLNMTFDKECVATQTSKMTLIDVAALKTEIRNDEMEIIAAFL